MKLKPILFGLMILLFTALVSAGANDPSRFGNLTDTTVMIGGAEGIIWTNGSNTFYVNDSLGKIGIGTSTPSEKLYIQDTGAAATVYIRGGDGNGVSHNAQIKLDADNDAAIFFVLNGSTSYLLSADRSDNLLRLTNGSFSNIFTIDQAGTAFFDGNVGIGKTNPATVLDVDGLVNASEYSGAINWSYNQNYPGACPANTYVTTIGDSITCTAITEITNNVTIAQTFFDNNTGNVGIGTTSPQSPLHITDTRPELTLQSDYNESAVQGYYKILDNGSNLYAFAGLDSDSNNDFTIRTTTYAAGIDFQTNSSSRIYIAKGGNVGIGTIAPSEKFDVVGNIKATGTIVGVWENGLSDDGLILNIPANEDALDYSGQGNDGTLYNDTTYTTGKFGESFSFDGVNDYVDMGDTDSLSFGDGTNDFPLTVSAWVYSTQTDINDYVLSKGIGYTSGEYSFYIAVGTIYLRIYDASASKYQQAYYEGSLPLNEWVYISATYDGRGGDNAASGISIYYNGNEVTTGINENAGYVAMENGAEPLVLGKYSTSFFNGSIDDVKIFNRSLSSDEIKALYSQSAEFYGRNSFRSTMGSVGIGTVSPTSKLEITQNNNELGLLIENAGNQHGIRVTQTGELASGFRALYLYSAALLDNGAELVKFYSDNPSSTDDVVELRNDGTGNGLFIDQNGNGASISIDSEAATQNMISWTSANTDRGVKITNPAAFTGTSNPGFFYVQLSSASSTKPLMTLENAGTGEGVFIDQNGNGIALNIDSEATTVAGLNLETINDGSGSALNSFGTYMLNIGDGGTLRLDRNSATPVEAILEVTEQAAANSQELIRVQNAGVGTSILVDQNGEGIALNIDSEATSAGIISIDSIMSSGTGFNLDITVESTANVMKLIHNHASSAGTVLSIDQDGNGNGIYLENEGTGNGLFINQDGNGIGLEIDSETTTLQGINVDTSVLTTGNAGRFYANSAAYTGAYGVLYVSQANEAGTGTAMRVDNSGTGNGLFLNQDGNGTALYIENDGTNDGISINQVGILANGENALRVYSGTEQVSHELVEFRQAHVDNNQPVLKLQQDGSGKSILIDQNGNGMAIDIDSEATSTYHARIVSGVANTYSEGILGVRAEHADNSGNVIKIFNAGTGNGLFIDQNGNGISLQIDSEATTNSAVFVDQAINNDASIINVKQNGQNAFRVYRNDDVETNTTITIGNYFLWVDSTGDLRINNGQPTSDTDGTVVGAQT